MSPLMSNPPATAVPSIVTPLAVIVTLPTSKLEPTPSTIAFF